MVTLQDKQIYNYDNDYDRLNYCSGIMDEPSDGNQFNDDENFGNPSPFKPTFKPTIFQDDNKTGVLATGALSQKNKIEYARFAKRFDTRQIKTSLWKILSDDTENNTDLNNIDTDVNVDKQPPQESHDSKTNFAKVYHSLLTELPSKSAESVSVPIALVCLLHLANEKNLSLEGNESMNNIQISVNKCLVE